MDTYQRSVIDAVLAGKSIFLTGAGGTGKSHILDVLYKEYTRTGRKMSVTALTGCAALLLGPHAKTLHSWAGIGLGRGPVAPMISAIALNGRKKKAWTKTDCLVIDEISMLQPGLLDTLDEIGRVIRKNRSVPMGGLQVVFVGDFHQLPPVNKEEKTASFAFQSAAWKRIVEANYELTTIYRQSDPLFQTVLNEARVGELSKESYATLEGRKGVSWKGKLIKPTLLFTRNDNVNELNRQHLEKLTGEAKVFHAVTQTVGTVSTGAGPKQKTIDKFFGKAEPAATLDPEELAKRVARLDKDAPYDAELTLKVGAQVMLLTNRNPEAGLVNGSRGVIVSFDGEDGVPIVKFLSVTEPVPVPRHEWEDEGETGGKVIRSQIPLRLAYALTIHKAQGASLDCALVDIGRSTFEYGQAYVALSRVRNLEGLYVYDIDPVAFRVHPAVKEFYLTLHDAPVDKIADEGPQFLE